jgi:hypothetical protein
MDNCIAIHTECAASWSEAVSISAILRLCLGSSTSAPDTPAPAQAGSTARQAYLRALIWAFTVFNSVRMISYVPTVLAIHASGDSSQHSLWTWGTWLGANLTMAAWLYEQNGQRLGRAAVVSLGNAAMCTVTAAVIVAHRVWTF